MVYSPIEDEMVDFVAKEIINKKLKDRDKLYSLRFFTNKFKAGPVYVKRAFAKMEARGLISEVEGEYYIKADDRKIEGLRENFANRILNEYLDQMAQIGINSKQALTFVEMRNKANG